MTLQFHHAESNSLKLKVIHLGVTIYFISVQTWEKIQMAPTQIKQHFFWFYTKIFGEDYHVNIIKLTLQYNVQAAFSFIFLQSTVILWLKLLVRGRYSLWQVSEALPLFPQLVVPTGSWSPLLGKSSTCSQNRPSHRRGCRSREEAGRGLLCGQQRRRHPHFLQSGQSMKRTLVEQCSSSLLHSSAP